MFKLYTKLHYHCNLDQCIEKDKELNTSACYVTTLDTTEIGLDTTSKNAYIIITIERILMVIVCMSCICINKSKSLIFSAFDMLQM